MTEREAELTRELEARVESWAPALLARASKPGAVSIDDYRKLVTTATWDERWPGAKGQMQTVAVQGEIWTRAIQAALDEHSAVRIPAREKPYYIDAPLVLGSGHVLIADAKAEIRLRPGVSTCMVRNAHPISGQAGPVSPEVRPDTGIVIEGGIWTTLATSPAESNGNERGCADAQDSIPGAHGVIFLDNIRRVAVVGVTIRQSRAFGVHIGVGSDFLVQGVRFEDHHRDGVHVEGPASYGVIRDIGGGTGDDLVSMNAWDWQNYSVAFGPIHHMLVEDIVGGKEIAGGGVEPDGTAEIRLLPGNKTFADGTKQACDLHDIVIRRVRAIRTFKMYDQPNLELGRDRDFSDPIGEMREIYLRGVTTTPTSEALVQVHANVDGLSVADVTLEAAQLPEGYALVSVGPQSVTYKMNADDPATWVEIFSPDKDCTVRNLHVTAVRLKGAPEDLDASTLAREIHQKPNPDYPNTLPRGGTGRGIIVR